jgi:hypothetical protein
VVNTSKDILFEYIDHIITKLADLIPSIKYLYLVNDTSSAVQEALVTLVNFFKSYTTDMLGMNVVYIFDSKATAMLKLIDAVGYMKASIAYNDKSFETIDDRIKKLISNIKIGNDIFFHEEIKSILGHVYLLETTGMLTDKPSYITKETSLIDQSIKITDDKRLHVLYHLADSILAFGERKTIVANLIADETITFDEGLILTKFVEWRESYKLFDIAQIHNKMTERENLLIRDFAVLTAFYYHYDDFKMVDNFKYVGAKDVVSDTSLSFSETYKLIWIDSP